MKSMTLEVLHTPEIPTQGAIQELSELDLALVGGGIADTIL